jgi:hypothetical protein
VFLGKHSQVQKMRVNALILLFENNLILDAGTLPCWVIIAFLVFGAQGG